MSPTIEITNETFKKFQSYAIPLVDTADTLLNRLIHSFESQKTGKAPAPAPASAPAPAPAPVIEMEWPNARVFNPDAAPDLTHTKLLEAKVHGHTLGRGQNNWNGFLNAVISVASKKSNSEAQFERLMTVNFKGGRKNDQGYHYLPDLDISVQGQDANGAWRAAHQLARQIGCQLSVKFAWRDKEDAAFPGVTGQLSAS